MTLTTLDTRVLGLLSDNIILLNSSVHRQPYPYSFKSNVILIFVSRFFRGIFSAGFSAAHISIERYDTCVIVKFWSEQRSSKEMLRYNELSYFDFT